MLPNSLTKIFLAITLDLDRKRSLRQTLFSALSPERTQGYDFRMVRARAEIFAIKAGSRAGQQRKKGRGEEWSDGDERHGRWAGIATREECQAVEHRGSDRDTRRNQRSDHGDRLQPPCWRAGIATRLQCVGAHLLQPRSRFPRREPAADIIRSSNFSRPLLLLNKAR